MHDLLNYDYFRFDALSFIMIALVGFIGLTIASFARRYLKGDRLYGQFFILLPTMMASVMVMVSANHLGVFLAAWCTSNLLLIRLMIHKSSWRAARAAGMLTLRSFALGAAMIAAAFFLLYIQYGTAEIAAIVSEPIVSAELSIALALLIGGALTQSGAWPFHKWLTSSLNSPTPVSAIMHAGLVNGGGFLLARFAPLFAQTEGLLTVLFVIGLLTAMAGTLWKLLQSDIKRMLACSTMGQMGFMLAQCGLGLFPAAIAHLVWHGMFKAYLFLATGSAAQEKRQDLHYPPELSAFFASLICGVAGSAAFTYVSGKSITTGDTTAFLVGIAAIAGAQFALPLLRDRAISGLLLALPLTGLIGAIYGGSVHLIIDLLAPLGLMQPMPLNLFHILGFILLVLAWLGVLFIRRPEARGQWPNWALHAYVRALNASQPHAATVTTHRNHYHYL